MSRVFSLWIGSELSIYEKLTLASALKFKHQFTLFSYENIEVPSGIIMADASMVIPKLEIYKLNNSYASFSNLFRYRVLQTEKFDAWVDMDIVFNSETLPSKNGYIFGYEDRHIINNAVLGYPAKSILAEKLVLHSNKFEKKWGHTGPILLTKLIQQESLQLQIQNSEKFYPISPWETNLLLTSRKNLIIDAKINESNTIHLWMDILKRFGFKKYKLPPRNSYLRKILRDFELDDPTLAVMSKIDLIRWNVKFNLGKLKHNFANMVRYILRVMN